MEAIPAKPLRHSPTLQPLPPVVYPEALRYMHIPLTEHSPGLVAVLFRGITPYLVATAASLIPAIRYNHASELIAGLLLKATFQQINQTGSSKRTA